MNGLEQAQCEYDSDQMDEWHANACDLLGSLAERLGLRLPADDEYRESFLSWSTGLQAHAAWLRGEAVDPGARTLRVVR